MVYKTRILNGPELRVSEEEQLASQGRSNAKTRAHEAELKTKAARTEIKNELNAIQRKYGLNKMSASPVDAPTLERMAGEIVKLDSAVLIHEIYAVVDDKCSEYKSGKSGLKDPAKWPGYLYVAIREEVAKLLRKTGLKEQVKSAAAGKGIAMTLRVIGGTEYRSGQQREKLADFQATALCKSDPGLLSKTDQVVCCSF
jgi:hypothetical protein